MRLQDEFLPPSQQCLSQQPAHPGIRCIKIQVVDTGLDRIIQEIFHIFSFMIRQAFTAHTDLTYLQPRPA